MDHGISALSTSEISTIESEIFDGSGTLDLVQTTWDHNRAPDSWYGPAWKGESGSGSLAERRRNDIEDAFGGTSRRLVLMYGISEVGTKSNYQPVLDGQYDAEFRSMAEDLVEMNMEDTIIRPNPEFNLWNRYPDSGDPADYRDAYARCVREMMNVPGANFTFIYNPAGHRMGITATAWPVDSPLWPSGTDTPIVTPSHYDQESYYGVTSDEWTNLNDSEKEAEAKNAWNNGHVPELDMWGSFAESVGADMGSIEWGTSSSEYPGGLGDNPYFVEYIFEYMEQNNWTMQAWWNFPSPQGGGHEILPTSDAELPESGEAWMEQVSGGVSSPPPPSIGGYSTPEPGSADWHTPLNSNFLSIENDITNVADYLGVSINGNYNRPEQGTQNWHIPINENFAQIEADLQILTDNIDSPPNLSEYAQPEEGALDWHIPLNNNFVAIENDLQSIVDTI